jgi:hypothetical protein
MHVTGKSLRSQVATTGRKSGINFSKRVIPIEAGARLKTSKPNDGGLISLHDVRRIFGIPMILAREDADAGILPHVRHGKVYLFRGEAVEKWLRDQSHRCRPAGCKHCADYRERRSRPRLQGAFRKH